MTLLTTTGAGYKTSIDRSQTCSYSSAQVNQQNVGCKSLSRGLNPLTTTLVVFIPHGTMNIFLPGPIKLLV